MSGSSSTPDGDETPQPAMEAPSGPVPARKSSRLAIWLPLALFVGIVGFQIFGPVPIGMANNNDFALVLGRLRLWPAPPVRDGDPHYLFNFFVNDYVIAEPYYNPRIPTSERLVAALAVRIGKVVLRRGTFRLQLMGLVHGAILTAALFIFLLALRKRRRWVCLTCGFLLVFIWTDLEYVQQLNTVYRDAGAIVAVAMVFSISVLCLLTAGGGSWAWSLPFCFFGCFLIASKTQHAIAAPFLVALCFWIGLRSHRRAAQAAWLSAPVLLLAAAVYIIEKTPADYRAPPAFTLLFYKLTVLSPDPKGVLADFGLPETFAQYVGHYAYEPNMPLTVPGFQKRIVQLITPASLGSFYWRHPDIVRKALSRDWRESASNVNLNSPVWYGHLREADVRMGRHPFVLSAWSGCRHWLFTIAPFHLIYFFSLVITCCGICALNPEIGKQFPLWPLALLSSLLAISAFLFASLLDAAETARHLVFFQAATDLTIVATVLSILLVVEDRRKQNVRVKSGKSSHAVSFLV